MTWAQEEMWRLYEQEEPSDWLLLDVCVEFASHITVPQIEQALNKVTQRHESLRTKFSAPLGMPSQHIEESNKIALTSIKYADEAAFEQAKICTLQSLKGAIDLGTEFPVRASVIENGGGVKCLILVIHHIAVDAMGINILRSELEQLVDDPDGLLLDVPAQPRHISREEASVTGKKRNDQALQYARQCLLDGPDFELPSIGAGQLHVRDSFTLSDPESFWLVNEIAKKEKLSTANIWLSAFSILVSLLSKNSAFILEMNVANRMTRARLNSVSHLNAISPCIVRVAPDATFRDVAFGCFASTMQAIRHGDCNRTSYIDMKESILDDRGGKFAYPVFNFVPEDEHSRNCGTLQFDSLFPDARVAHEGDSSGMAPIKILVHPAEATVYLTINRNFGIAGESFFTALRSLFRIAMDREFTVSDLSGLLDM